MRPFLVVAYFVIAALPATGALAQTPTPSTSKPPASKMPAVQAELDTLYTLANGRQVHATGHFYRNAKGQTREDSSLGAVITDLAAGTITLLVTETKEARLITIPAEQRTLPARSNRPTPEVFEETQIEGRRVSKARADGPMGQKVELWTATDLGIVLRTKTEAPGLSSMREMKIISTAEPNPSLFQIPRDYTVIRQEAPRPDAPRMEIPARANPQAESASKAAARRKP